MSLLHRRINEMIAPMNSIISYKFVHFFLYIIIKYVMKSVATYTLPSFH